jgi:small subunit ribosomal protein S7
MSNVLAFNRWDCSELKVNDPGLVDYVTIKPVIVPRTGARYAGNRFHKSKIFVVERLINKMMVPGRAGTKKHKHSSGHVTGKAATAYSVVLDAFEIIEK